MRRRLDSTLQIYCYPQIIGVDETEQGPYALVVPVGPPLSIAKIAPSIRTIMTTLSALPLKALAF